MNKKYSSSNSFFIAILLLATIGFASLDVYLPSLPAIKDFFSTSNFLVQLSLSAYLFSFSLSQLIYGPCSDRWGRKGIALLGIAISCIGTIVCFFSYNIYILLFGRFLQGLGLGAGAAIFRPALRDVFEGDNLAHFGSILGIGTAIASALGPTFGGYIQQYIGWRGNFVFLLLYALSTLIYLWHWLPETNTRLNIEATKPKTFIKNYVHLITNPIFIGYGCCSSLAYGGLTAYLTASPFLFQEVIGLTAIQYGWLSFLLASGMMLGAFLNSKMIRRFGRHRTLVVGIIIHFVSATTMLVFGLFHILNTWVIIVPMLCFTLGSSIVLANSFAGAFTPFAKIAGFAGALYGCLQIAGGTLTSAIVAKIHENNQLPLAILLLVIAISSYFFQLIAFKHFMRHHPH